MPDMDRKTRLAALSDGLDALIRFADQEEDFVLAAKLDDARVRFNERYTFQPADLHPQGRSVHITSVLSRSSSVRNDRAAAIAIAMLNIVALDQSCYHPICFQNRPGSFCWSSLWPMPRGNA